MRYSIPATVICIIFLSITSVISAEVPRMFNYQGYLTDSNGDPLDGTYNFNFRIYDAETEGTNLWHETHNGVTVSDGVFNVVLGSIGAPSPELDPDIFANNELWLGITVNSDPEIVPRTRLVSIPYGFRVETIDGATAGEVFGDLTLSGYQPPSTCNEAKLKIVPCTGYRGYLEICEGYYQIPTIKLCGGDDYFGRSYIDINHPETGEPAVSIYGGTYGGGVDAGSITLYALNEDQMIEIDGHASPHGGACIKMWNSDCNERIIIQAEPEDNEGPSLIFKNSPSDTAVWIDAQNGDLGGAIRLYDYDGVEKVSLQSESSTDWGSELTMRAANGTTTVSIAANSGTLAQQQGSRIHLYDHNGDLQINIDAEYGYNGSGRIVTPVLEITGGSDLSEQFDVASYAGISNPEAGMLVCIDPDNPGRLMISNKAYDHTVAGIISGAGDVTPGMLMGHKGTIADGQYPIALTGRVYCLADASQGSIMPGDLLTTSDIPGYAMKVTDRQKAQGAIIGKAMTALEDGEGLILVLVSLQ